MIIGVSNRKRIKGADKVVCVCEDMERFQLILEKVTFGDSVME